MLESCEDLQNIEFAKEKAVHALFIRQLDDLIRYFSE